MTGTSDITVIWNALKAWLTIHLPETENDLRKGCTAGELADFEAHVGLALPDDFRELYLQNDGQASGLRSVALPPAPGVCYGLALLPLEEIRRNWDSWRELAEDGPEGWMNRQVIPEGFVDPAYINTGRIPLTDFNGNHLGLDLSPGPLGTWGQIISYGADESVHHVLAPSLSMFLHWLWDELKSGNFEIDRDEDGIQFTTRSPGHEIFLDSIPELFGLKD